MSDCSNGHRGPFSFGCTQGVLRCDACGKTWFPKDVTEKETTFTEEQPTRPKGILERHAHLKGSRRGLIGAGRRNHAGE